ncbi:MAG: transposase [Actinomycetota bacterium]|nr:transposase [Actinomycetota bacterium]
MNECIRHLTRLTLETAPELVEAFGIDPDIAGELLCAAFDNIDRIRSEAAFAKLYGVSPIPASSGKMTDRYRLNRSRNRQANAALLRAVIVRMSWLEPAITYVKKRTVGGFTKKGHPPFPRTLCRGRSLWTSSSTDDGRGCSINYIN